MMLDHAVCIWTPSALILILVANFVSKVKYDIRLSLLLSLQPLQDTASSVYFPLLSSRSEQVCLASSDLLHTHLALAGKHCNYYYYY